MKEQIKQMNVSEFTNFKHAKYVNFKDIDITTFDKIFITVFPSAGISNTLILRIEKRNGNIIQTSVSNCIENWNEIKIINEKLKNVFRRVFTDEDIFKYYDEDLNSTELLSIRNL